MNPTFSRFACTLLSVCLFCTTAAAEILHVPDDYETIQGAIDEAEEGDTVLVFQGVYRENIDYKGKNITVTSLFSITGDEEYIDSTVIDGNENGSVITFENGENETAILIGLTIKNGHSDGNGGGIYCLDSNPNILNCYIMENQADSLGGGIYVNADMMVIHIDSCEIIANSASGGGGIGSDNGILLLANVILAGNVSRDSLGGAIYASWFTKLTANRVTIVNNVAEDAGSIYCWAHTVQLINSILWNDTPHEVVGYTHGDGDHIMFSHCDVKGDSNGVYLINIQPLYWLESNIDIDPLFVDQGSSDYNLTEHSPCVDAGTALFVWWEDTLVNIPEDQYNGLAPDIGAFESEFVNDAPFSSFIPHPSSLILYPAYPNPFNSATTFRFELPAARWVSLAVYDIQGRKVARIAEGQYIPGIHNISWNAESLPSGSYLVKLSDGVRTKTTEIAVIK